MAPLEQQVKMVPMVHRVLRDQLEHKVLLVPQVVLHLRVGLLLVRL
jgi:hypothetical protein